MGRIPGKTDESRGKKPLIARDVRQWLQCMQKASGGMVRFRTTDITEAAVQVAKMSQ